MQPPGRSTRAGFSKHRVGFADRNVLDALPAVDKVEGVRLEGGQVGHRAIVIVSRAEAGFDGGALGAGVPVRLVPLARRQIHDHELFKAVWVAHRDERTVSEPERRSPEIEDPAGGRKGLDELAPAHVEGRRQLHPPDVESPLSRERQHFHEPVRRERARAEQRGVMGDVLGMRAATEDDVVGEVERFLR
jgi:hypothetical protein